MAAEITVIDLDLYSEHRPEERITGSKTDLDLSARSTYTRVYMVVLLGRSQILYLLSQPCWVLNLLHMVGLLKFSNGYENS